MSQRVNIQYSIDLDDLPQEIDRLVEMCEPQISKATEILHNLKQSDSMSAARLDTISDLRLALAKTDHILEDVSKIITGYLRMSVMPPREIPEHTQTHSAPTTPFKDQTVSNSTIQDLQNKLNNFKDMVNNEDAPEVTTG